MIALLRTHLDRALGRFRDDQRGSLTIEFVLWVPVLSLWLIFSLMLYDAHETQNKATKTAYTISDIISRSSVLNEALLNEVFLLQDMLLPRASANKALRITNVQCVIDPDASEEGCTYNVLWSVRRASENFGEGFDILTEAENLPVNIFPVMQDQEEVLLVEQNVPYEPIVDWMGIDAREWTVRVLTRTRYVTGLALSTELAAENAIVN